MTPPQLTLKASTDPGKDALPNSFQKLSYRLLSPSSAFLQLGTQDQSWLRSHLQNYPQAFSAIILEPDPELFFAGLLDLGRKCKFAGEEAKGLRLFQFLQKIEVPQTIRSQAKREAEAILGQGCCAGRIEFLLHRFAQETTDYKTILPMMAATTLFGFSKALSFSRLTASPRTLWATRSWGAKWTASLAATALEIPTFALSARTLRQWEGGAVRRNLGEDLASATLCFGGLKLGAGLGRALGLALFTRPILSARLSWIFPQDPLPLWRAGFSQGGTFLGLASAQFFEGKLGLRHQLDGATAFTDLVASMLSLGIGGHLGRRLLGARVASLQGEIDFRVHSAHRSPVPVVVPPPWATYRSKLHQVQQRPAPIRGVVAGAAPSRSFLSRDFRDQMRLLLECETLMRENAVGELSPQEIPQLLHQLKELLGQIGSFQASATTKHMQLMLFQVLAKIVSYEEAYQGAENIEHLIGLFPLAAFYSDRPGMLGDRMIGKILTSRNFFPERHLNALLDQLEKSSLDTNLHTNLHANLVAYYLSLIAGYPSVRDSESAAKIFNKIQACDAEPDHKAEALRDLGFSFLHQDLPLIDALVSLAQNGADPDRVIEYLKEIHAHYSRFFIPSDIAKAIRQIRAGLARPTNSPIIIEEVGSEASREEKIARTMHEVHASGISWTHSSDLLRVQDRSSSPAEQYYRQVLRGKKEALKQLKEWISKHPEDLVGIHYLAKLATESKTDELRLSAIRILASIPHPEALNVLCKVMEAKEQVFSEIGMVEGGREAAALLEDFLPLKSSETLKEFFASSKEAELICNLAFESPSVLEALIRATAKNKAIVNVLSQLLEGGNKRVLPYLAEFAKSENGENAAEMLCDLAEAGFSEAFQWIPGVVEARWRANPNDTTIGLMMVGLKMIAETGNEQVLPALYQLYQLNDAAGDYLVQLGALFLDREVFQSLETASFKDPQVMEALYENLLGKFQRRHLLLEKILLLETLPEKQLPEEAHLSEAEFESLRSSMSHGPAKVREQSLKSLGVLIKVQYPGALEALSETIQQEILQKGHSGMPLDILTALAHGKVSSAIQTLGHFAAKDAKAFRELSYLREDPNAKRALEELDISHWENQAKEQNEGALGVLIQLAGELGRPDAWRIVLTGDFAWLATKNSFQRLLSLAKLGNRFAPKTFAELAGQNPRAFIQAWATSKNKEDFPYYEMALETAANSNPFILETLREQAPDLPWVQDFLEKLKK